MFVGGFFNQRQPMGVAIMAGPLVEDPEIQRTIESSLAQKVAITG